MITYEQLQDLAKDILDVDIVNQVEQALEYAPNGALTTLYAVALYNELLTKKGATHGQEEVEKRQRLLSP